MLSPLSEKTIRNTFKRGSEQGSRQDGHWVKMPEGRFTSYKDGAEGGDRV